MPMGSAVDGLRPIRDLRASLEALAEALSRGETGAVLGQEPGLRAALAAAQGPAAAALSADPAVTIELEGARTALARCRAIGAAHAHVTGVTLEALGRGGSYSRRGSGAPRGPRGRDVTARV